MLEKLCHESDINACRPDDDNISWGQFQQADFRLRRMPAALAIIQILNRRESFVIYVKENPSFKNASYYNRNFLSLASPEVKDALKALLIEYETDIRRTLKKYYQTNDIFPLISAQLDDED